MSFGKTSNEPSCDGSLLKLPSVTKEGGRRRRSISLDNSDLDSSVNEGGLVALNDAQHYEQKGDANLQVEMSAEHQR